MTLNPVTLGELGGFGCSKTRWFPTAAIPVLPILGGEATNEHDMRVFGFAGFAADGVVKVEFVSATGAVLASAPIRDNIFETPAANGQPLAGVKAVFLNEKGETVYEEGY